MSESLKEFIYAIGRDNIPYLLAYFLIKRLLNGLIPCIDAYLRARVSEIQRRLDTKEKSL